MSGAEKSTTDDVLVGIVKRLYPDVLTRTYTIPPVHFNTVWYDKIKVPGTDSEVLVLSCLQQEVHIWTDIAQQHVLHSLQQLAESENEVMFVVSELNFKDYLNKPLYAKQTGKLPKPGNLPEEHRHHGKQGDFDILVIHRQHGILIGEIKCVGKTGTSQADSKVARVIGKAVQQLDKCEVHVRHMVSDVAPGLTVRKTLFLLYVSRTQLQRILDDNSWLNEELCRSLQVDSSVEAVTRCYTSDVLVAPKDWWKRLKTDAGSDLAMTDDFYLHLVARFGGPASTVRVHSPFLARGGQRSHQTMNTVGQAVVETANRFSTPVLHPMHIDILQKDSPRVFLTGPAGTGICIMLAFKGLGWLHLGHHVHVISTWYGSVASSHTIVGQMKERASTKEMIHFHSLDLDQDDLAASEALVRTLAGMTEEGQLFLIANEVYNEATTDRPFTDFCNELHSRIPQLHLYLWAASQYRQNRPPMLEEIVLTEPLRIPPSVTRQLQQCDYAVLGRDIPAYTESSGPLPTDGLTPIFLAHAGKGHDVVEAPDCLQCGREVARTLSRLDVGKSYHGSSEHPRFSDVLILSRGNVLHDTTRDAAGNVTHAASGLIQGLRESDIPVTVIARGDAVGLREIATRTGPDHVVAAFCADVKDLERRIVVWVQSSEFRLEENIGKMQACGCCSAQLVCVEPPPDQEYPSSSDDNDGDNE